MEQFEATGETGESVIEYCAGDGGCVESPDLVEFAAGAVEGADRGSFVEMLVD